MWRWVCGSVLVMAVAFALVVIMSNNSLDD